MWASDLTTQRSGRTFRTNVQCGGSIFTSQHTVLIAEEPAAVRDAFSSSLTLESSKPFGTAKAHESLR